jgi:hypothetical protein
MYVLTYTYCISKHLIVLNMRGQRWNILFAFFYRNLLVLENIKKVVDELKWRGTNLPNAWRGAGGGQGEYVQAHSGQASYRQSH